MSEKLTSEQMDELKRLLRDCNVFKLAQMLPTLPKPMVEAACTQLKLQGNNFFKRRDYARALECYTSALAGMPDNATLYSNRSVCYLREKEHEKAIQDAERCMQLRPDWAKGYYRKGTVLLFQEKYEDAVAYFRKANELEPNDPEIRRCLREAEGLEFNQRATLASTMGQPMPKQPIRRPEIPDPKFDPKMLAQKISEDDEWYRNSKAAQGIVAFLQTSDVVWNQPKRLVEALDDKVLVAAWQRAIKQVVGAWEADSAAAPVSEKPEGSTEETKLSEENQSSSSDDKCSARRKPSMLLFGGLLGHLLMTCLDEGVSDIQLIEAAPVFTRKVRDVILDNYEAEEAERLLKDIKLAIRPPLSCRAGHEVQERYSVLAVANFFNHDVFSSRIVQHVRHAKNNFLQEAHHVMPCRIEAHAVLVQWLDEHATEGVKVSAVQRYRWNPRAETVDLSTQHHVMLTEAAVVADINLQDAMTVKPFDCKVGLRVVRDGVAHGVVTWLTIHLAPGVTIHNNPFAKDEERENFCRFLKPTYQYFDALPVAAAGDSPEVELTVHFNETQLWFERNPRNSIVRSHLVPQWYFEMMHDHPRNRFYRQAIRQMVAKWEAQHAEAQQCVVLDVGSGMGLLSVYAAQASANVKVYAAESSKHLALTSRKVLTENGVQGQVKVVKRDARRLSPKDIPEKADCLIFEVFDAGLLGEGILHFVEPIRTNVVKRGVEVLPQKAKIIAQVIELRTKEVAGRNFEAVNSFRFRPEYFNADLASLEHRALSAPFDVFEFDFQKQYRRQFTKLGAQQELFEVEMTAAGVVSAVVFWWELQLTDDISMSTGPNEEYSLHWKQAIQYVPEVQVDEGAKLPLVGMHNTYGVQWAIHPDKATLREGLTILTKPARMDPELEKMHQQINETQEKFYKALNTNEKEFLRIRTAMMRLAVQPGAFGLEPQLTLRLLRSFLA